MLTTIEEKLSAIKAINESIDKIEFHRGATIRIRETINSVDSVSFISENKSYKFDELPTDVRLKILDIVDQHFIDEKQRLMLNAQQLMK